MDSIPGSGRAAGIGDGNPLQHSCLENPMDRGAWWVTVCGVKGSQTGLKRLSTTHSCLFSLQFSLENKHRLASLTHERRH